LIKIPFQAMLAFGFLFFSGGLCSGTETLQMTVSASPSTFKSAGEKITFTYNVLGDDYIVFSQGYSVTDDAADVAPVCSKVRKDQMNCIATHTVTAADLALGYVTSHAAAQVYVATSNLWQSTPVELTEEATTVVYIENFVPSPTPTVTPPLSATPAATATSTATITPTSPPSVSLEGAVESDLLSCRYGPGAQYLYQYGLSKDNEVQVLGKAETAGGLWLYIQAGGYDRPCWVNAKFLQVEGDASTLAQVYPQQAPLILFYHDKFPPVTNVEASRSGDSVYVQWSGYELALGDRESAESPQYLVEFWTCQGGQIVFTSYGAFEEAAVVQDEAGCAEPSHGQVFIAHKDGYVGPVAIPWPAR
jgi:hypothetical protein